MAEVNIIDSVVPDEESRRVVRKIIPVLIEWARAGKYDGTYGALCRIVQTDLEHIGTRLVHVQRVIDAVALPEGSGAIPPLGSLVKSKVTGLPSNGFSCVYPSYKFMNDGEKRRCAASFDKKASEFDRWDSVLKVLGCEVKLFLKQAVGCINLTVHATASWTDQRVVVKAGSDIVLSEKVGLLGSVKKLRDDCLSDGRIKVIEPYSLGRLEMDQHFTSLTSAGMFVIGAMFNGQKDWKTRDGKPFCAV